MAMDETALKQPRDIDPYGLLSDGEEYERTDVMPYDPSRLEAMQASGRF